MTTIELSPQTREYLNTPRWVYGDPHWWSIERGCPFCGSMRTGKHMPCEPGACLLCGSVQCNNTATCRVCHYGWLPGWWRDAGSDCGYAKCGKAAVAVVPGRKRACIDHATRRVGAHVVASIAVRDSAAGWRKWVFSGPRASW